MMKPSTLERAFELARSGDYTGVAQIRKQLLLERFDLVETHLSGSAVKKQIRDVCMAARRSHTVDTNSHPPDDR